MAAWWFVQANGSPIAVVAFLHIRILTTSIVQVNWWYFLLVFSGCLWLFVVCCVCLWFVVVVCGLLWLFVV